MDRLKENLELSKFRVQTAAGQGKLSKDRFMNLFDKPSQPLRNMTAASMTTTTTTPVRTTPTPTTTTTAASSPLRVPSSPVKLSQRFNIMLSSDKLKLAMELASEMDTP
jgi:cell division septation protein DedD